MKIAASIGAVVLVILIFLYANGNLRSTNRIEGRNQLPGTAQGTSESEAERQRLGREAEQLRLAQEAKQQQRIKEEQERLRAARKAERVRAQEEERQRMEEERVDTEQPRVANEAGRQRKAREEIQAERQRKLQEEADSQRVAQEEAEKKRRDADLKQCVQKAEDTYSASVDRACRQIDSPPKCILPPLVLARFDGVRRDTTEECARLYPVK